MDVKFPGRFNAQNQWLDTAYGINLEYIQHYDNEDVVLLLDGVKTANIQAPADSFE